jgi:hypothetical protein
MTEATDFHAKAIHRLLEVDPNGQDFNRCKDNPASARLAERHQRRSAIDARTTRHPGYRRRAVAFATAGDPFSHI